jgi:AraC-like DNA-binding protein/ligand-binding sensor protein
MDTDGKSLLSRLMEEVRSDSGLHLCFEDLSGLILDIPDVKLPYSLRIHTCEFCLHAKKSPESHQFCVRNKMAANRMAIRRRAGYCGQCHLGLTELVSPLIFHGQVLGVFYYGAFVLTGTEIEMRSRIVKFCRRNGFRVADYINAFNHAPRVDPDRLPELWRRLSLVTDLALAIIEGHGIPASRYRTRPGMQFVAWSKALSPLVRVVIAYINHNYGSPLRVHGIAATHHCNPDYLSRTFKKTVGIGLIDYIQHIRINHAQRLLLSHRFSIGEISFMVGFQDHSHFCKVFRGITGITPQEHRNSASKTGVIAEQGFSTFEYSNIRSFNPQFGGTFSGKRSLIM